MAAQERDESFLSRKSVLKGNKRFPAKIALQDRQQQAVKKQSYIFQMHKTAEPYVVVSLLFFLLVKASSNTFWHTEDQTFLWKTDKNNVWSVLCLHAMGLIMARWKLEQHDGALTSYITGQCLYITYYILTYIYIKKLYIKHLHIKKLRHNKFTFLHCTLFLHSRIKGLAFHINCQDNTQEFDGWTGQINKQTLINKRVHRLFRNVTHRIKSHW